MSWNKSSNLSTIFSIKFYICILSKLGNNDGSSSLKIMCSNISSQEQNAIYITDNTMT